MNHKVKMGYRIVSRVVASGTASPKQGIMGSIHKVSSWIPRPRYYMTEEDDSLPIGLGTWAWFSCLHSRLGVIVLSVPSKRLMVVGSIFPLIPHWVSSVGFFFGLKILDAF